MGVKFNSVLIATGDEVYVHCRGGVHLAVAMRCCILIEDRHSAESALALMKHHREKADPEVWNTRRQISLFARKPV